MQTAHAGGLLAFFTGGSLITIFQILSIILRSPCRCVRKCSGGHKKESAEVRKCGLGNHILLNPNDVNDEGSVANSSSTRSTTNNNSQLHTHPFRASKLSQGTSSPPHQHRLQGYSTLPTSLGSITVKTPAPNNLAACQRNAKPQTCSPRIKSDCNSSKQKPQCAKKSPIDRFYKQAETDI